MMGSQSPQIGSSVQRWMHPEIMLGDIRESQSPQIGSSVQRSDDAILICRDGRSGRNPLKSGQAFRVSRMPAKSLPRFCRNPLKSGQAFREVTSAAKVADVESQSPQIGSSVQRLEKILEKYNRMKESQSPQIGSSVQRSKNEKGSENSHHFEVAIPSNRVKRSEGTSPVKKIFVPKLSQSPQIGSSVQRSATLQTQKR